MPTDRLLALRVGSVIQRVLLAAIAASLAVAGTAGAEEEWSKPDYAYEFSENDGLGYETVIVNGWHRDFAPIHAAAGRGDVATIRSEIAKGVPVDLQVSHSGRSLAGDGSTPLHWAAARGRVEAVRVLLDAGADIEARTEGGETALMIAAGSIPTVDGDPAACLRLLVERGANLEAVDTEGNTALFHAASKWVPVEEPPTELLRPEHRRLDPFRNLRPGSGGGIGGQFDGTRCHFRSRNGDAERVKILLDAGASPNAVNSSNETPLWQAAEQADAERVRLLVDAGAVLTEHAGPCVLSPLGLAAQSAPLSVFLEVLRAAGGPEAVLQSERREWVIKAAAAGYEGDRKLELLIGAGWKPRADARVADEAMQSAAGAYERGLPGMLPLLRAGILPPEQVRDGQSMLAWGAQRGSAEVLARLLSVLGTDRVNEPAKDEWASTLLMFAAESDVDAAAKVRLLLDAGAAINARDSGGRPAIFRAAAAGRMSAVEALAQRGAEVRDAAPVLGVNPQFATKLTALDLVCSAGAGTFMSEEPQEGAIAALLERGARIDGASVDNGESPLDEAIALTYPEYRLMNLGPGIRLGLEPSIRPGATLAVSTKSLRLRRNDSIVHLLLERGADASARDAHGATLLMRACASVPDPALAQLLVEHGADPLAQDREGCTAAHYAAGALNAGVIEILSAKGVDWSAADRTGRRPIDLARRSRTQHSGDSLTDDELDELLKRFEALVRAP